MASLWFEPFPSGLQNHWTVVEPAMIQKHGRFPGPKGLRKKVFLFEAKTGRRPMTRFDFTISPKSIVGTGDPLFQKSPIPIHSETLLRRIGYASFFLRRGTHYGDYQNIWVGLHLSQIKCVTYGSDSFSVWGSHTCAKGFCRVGDFNGWDGRVNPMAKR